MDVVVGIVDGDGFWENRWIQPNGYLDNGLLAHYPMHYPRISLLLDKERYSTTCPTKKI